MKTISSFTFLLLIIQIANSQNLDFGLQGHYKFNQNLSDSSSVNIEGIGYNLEPSLGIEELPETGFIFNGTNSYIDLSNYHRNVVDQVTLSAWVRTTEDKREFIISKYNYNHDKGYFLAIEDGIALVGGRDNSGQFYQCFSEKTVNDGEWHHIVGIIDENNWQIWIDCELENTLTTNSVNVELNCTDPLTIGNWYQGNGNGEFRFFDGLIDEIRIYNRPLTEEEILLLCELNTVSIDRVEIELQEIKVIPNPVNETFEVVFLSPVEQKVTYNLYDSLGRNLKSGELDNSISISNFSAGYFILHLLINDRLIAIEKIVRQ